MNYVLALLFSSLLMMSSNTKKVATQYRTDILSCKPEATCYGNTPCNACKNCNYCKYCNSGGTCGICAPQKKPQSKPQPGNYGQCKAITKKGTRCKRAAGPSGYCWQHG